MFERIKRIDVSLRDTDFLTLFSEGVLFSAIYGVAFRSWVVFGVMFTALVWLLNRPRGMAHVIYVMSFLWGFIAFSIGFSISWLWAVALGGTFFMFGIRAHRTGLKKSWGASLVALNQDNREWQRITYQGRRNLN